MQNQRIRYFIAALFSTIAGSSVRSQDATPVVPSAYTSSTPVNYIRTWNATAPEQNPNTLINRNLRDVKQSTQYADGLGRPLQTVVKQGSYPTGGSAMDLVKPVVYDEFGRETRKYLPFAANTNGGNASLSDGLFKLNPFQQQQYFYSDNNTNSPVKGQGETFYYGKTEYEASPLNRVDKIYAPGNNWVNQGKGVNMKYYVNTATDAVRIWNVTDGATGSFSTYTSSGIYAAGLLYKNITVDEKNNQVIEFKDKEGRVILKKVQLTATADDGTGSDHAGWLCTYYIYNNLGNLSCVIQPLGVQLIASTWSLTDATILAEQCFRYEYDSRNRMIIKKAPGAGEVYMVYDMRDRLVFTQDARQRAQNQWLTTLYDRLDRPVITGLTTYAASMADMQLQVINQTTSTSTAPSGLLADLNLPQDIHTTTGTYDGNYQAFNSITMNDGFETTDNAEFSATIVNSDGEPLVLVDGQSINKYPLPSGASLSVLTTTYYDNYNSIPSGFSTTSLYASGYAAYLDASGTEYPGPLTLATSVSGLITGTKVKVLGEDKYIISCNLYDQKGRVIQVQTQNYTGAMDIVTNQYSFAGQLLRSHIKHQKGGTNAQGYDLATKNTYDDLGRMSTVEENLNAVGWKQIASITYDALGQLKTKKLSPAFNSNAGLETLTYDYNIRGWILGANRDYAKSTTGTDHYFGFDLGYDKQTIASIGSYTAPQFNGNITGTVWKSKGDGQLRKYDFTYDAANRLTSADFNQYSGSFDKSAGVDFSVSNLTYDANGNIITQTQRGLKLSSSDYIDQLTYHYIPNSNRLQNVIDGSNDTQTKLGDFRASQAYMTALNGTKTNNAVDYSYDVNGNMNADKNKDITSITYNHLNLPQTITIANEGSIDYIYDATGAKLKKTVHEAGKPDKTTLYLFGTYEDDVLQFLPQGEGRIRPVRDGNGAIASFTYDYFLKDHLGNVRMVLTEEQKTDIYQAGMEDANRAAEVALFGDKINSTANAKPGGFDNDNTNQKVSVVNGTTAEGRVGPGVILKVMAGDKINAKTFAWYQPTGMDNSTDPGLTGIITNLLGQLVPGITGVAHGTMASQVTNGVVQPGMESFLGTQNPASGAPKAYLNWILLDEEQFKLVNGNYGAVPVPQITGTQEKQLLQSNSGNPIEIKKNGYLYIHRRIFRLL